jgi:hypothetical protein
MGDYVEEILDYNDWEIQLMDMLDYDAVYHDEELSELFSNPELIDTRNN